MPDYKKDSMAFGMLVAIVAPLATFVILYLLIWLVTTVFDLYPLLSLKKLILITVIPNLLLLRMYMRKYLFENTGKGIIMVTFAIIALFFLLTRTIGQISLPGLLQ